MYEITISILGGGLFNRFRADDSDGRKGKDELAQGGQRIEDFLNFN